MVKWMHSDQTLIKNKTCNEPEEFLAELFRVGFCGFTAPLIWNPPQMLCLVPAAIPGSTDECCLGPPAQMETVMLWIAARWLYKRVFCWAEHNDVIMGGALIILQHVNIKLMYLWIAALEFFALKIAVWVADLSFRKKSSEFCLEIGAELPITSEMTILKWFDTVYSCKSEFSAMITKIKVLNSEKCWRCSLECQIFSQDLILHAKLNKEIDFISIQTCFPVSKWKDMFGRIVRSFLMIYYIIK